MSYYGPDQPGEPWRGADQAGAGDPYGSADGQWGPEPRQGSKALVAVLATVLVIVLCGGGVGALYLIGSRTGTPSARASTPPVGATDGATGGASASPSDDPTSIKEKDCVVNEGSDDDPRLKVVPCAKGTLLVLKRFPGTTDIAVCNDVKGATHHYFYDTTPDSDDFVLCLQQQ